MSLLIGTESGSTVVVAHGTRNPAGVAVARRLAAAVGAELAFVDVLAPRLRDVLARVPGPVTVVPAFLAAGYHVRVDLPDEVAASGRDDVTVTDPLGPAVAPVAADRLRAAGCRPGDAVVLAAAGSAEPRAVLDVRRAARGLAAVLRHPVGVCTVPSLPSVVARLHADGRRVAVAPWLLAPGVFHRGVMCCGADVVAAPLGEHPVVVARLAALAGGSACVPEPDCSPARPQSAFRN